MRATAPSERQIRRRHAPTLFAPRCLALPVAMAVSFGVDAVAAPAGKPRGAPPAAGRNAAAPKPPATKPAVGPAGAAPVAPAGDAELSDFAKKLGEQVRVVRERKANAGVVGPRARVEVYNVKAEPVAGNPPGAKIRMTVVEGDPFSSPKSYFDIELRRSGDRWACVGAKATFMIDLEPVEPANVTADDVRRALAAMGAGEGPQAGARDELVKWVAAHNVFGPDHPIGDDMGKLADPSLAKDENFSILLGPGLLKSGKAARVGVYCRQFFAAEYTDAQVKKAGLEARNVVRILEGGTAERRVPAVAEMGKLAFNNPGPWDLSQGITGTVPVRALRSLPEGQYVLRLSYTAGGTNVILYHHIGGWLFDKEAKPIKFGFAAAPAGAAKHSGPLLVFLDVCEMTNVAGVEGNRVEVLSPTTVMVVDVTPGKAK